MPDTEALRYGKEFGNRGQCNPTYFTVGNLVKYLVHLRDARACRSRRSSDTRFFTAGACGPCRFGTYVTEYRKALRDSGFDGFRVLLFQQQGGLQQATGEDRASRSTPRSSWRCSRSDRRRRAQPLGYRIRPYEVKPARPIARSRSASRSSRRVRAEASVAAGAAAVPPRLEVEGQPAAAQAEGLDHRRVLGDDDGRRRQLPAAAVPRSRGRRGRHPAVTAWLLYNIWEHTLGHAQRMTLRREDRAISGLKGTNPRRNSRCCRVAEQARCGACSASMRARSARRLSPGRHGRDRDDLAPVLRQPPPRRRRPHGGRQADSERRAARRRTW